MKTIVACDLHGSHSELRALLAPLGDGVSFLSPWAGEGCPYASEQLAHQALIANRGIEAYAEKIAERAEGEPVFLIAFSVGATAAWLYACSDQVHPGGAAVLFYGSRIRDFAERVPRIPITAVFAEREASFAPGDLIRAIASAKVRSSIVPGTSHGFMNPLSPNFDAVLAISRVSMLVKAHEAWLAAAG